MSDPEAPSEAGPMGDRRAFLGKAAVGGAVAWVAPTIMSVTAASAATGQCTNNTVLWSDWASSVPNLNPPGTGSFDIGIGSLSLLTVSYDISGMTAGGTAIAQYAATSPLGAETTDFLQLTMDSLANGESCQLTFDFSGSPVTAAQGLTFTILDADLSTGFWQDRLIFTATNGASPVLATSIITGPDNTATVAGNTDVLTGTNDPTGNGTPNDETGANATVTYAQPITKLVIEYVALSGNQLQQIGISSLNFCLYE